LTGENIGYIVNNIIKYALILIKRRGGPGPMIPQQRVFTLSKNTVLIPADNYLFDR